VNHKLVTKLKPIHVALGALLLVCVDANWLHADTVIRKSGPQKRGTIEKSSRDGIVIDGTPIRVSDIRYVMFSDEPKELRTIRDAVSKGSYGRAEQALQRLDMSELSGDLMQMDALFYQAYVKARRALQTGQNRGAAVKEMVTFAKTHQSSFHFYEAAEVLGELALALGKEDESAKYFGALEKASAPGVKLRGMTRMAELLMARGAYPDALKRYDAMLKLDGDDQARTTAQLGKAVCQAEMGDGESGIKAVEQIIQETDEKQTELMARAYNTLGACYRVAGKNNAAVMAYLHVDLLYSKHNDQHAEALYHLGTLWAKTGHQDRAAQARALLKSKYGGSSWAAK
jgi:tetratricopeptide (TPR) repeat protein